MIFLGGILNNAHENFPYIDEILEICLMYSQDNFLEPYIYVCVCVCFKDFIALDFIPLYIIWHVVLNSLQRVKSSGGARIEHCKKLLFYQHHRNKDMM